MARLAKPCSVNGCGNLQHTGDLCGTHLRRLRTKGSVLADVPVRRRGDHPHCTVDGCTKKVYGYGHCATHYSRQRRRGDVLADVPVREAFVGFPEVFWRNVVKAEGCWSWLGYHSLSGYAYGREADGSPRAAHIIAYELTYGPVPGDRVLDHFACDNGAGGCCNPHHVRPVTHRENALRSDSIAALNLAKTHCSRGHEFAGSNLRLSPKGNRICLACVEIRTRQRPTTVQGRLERKQRNAALRATRRVS